MSLEAMKQVTETEQAARARKAEAQAQAKRLVADAERDGKARLAQARAEAEAQARELMQDEPAWPKEGSVVELEEYIVVNFGNQETGE